MVSIDTCKNDTCNKLYVVFSATPFKMGKIIRRVTKNEYNHVSVSLDRSLESLYSFARYYKNTPFYGGFVEESLRRYQCCTTDSYIMVCELSLTAKQYNCINETLHNILDNRDMYIYNLMSAVCFPFGKSVHINGCYTCIEFVCNLLRKLGIYQNNERCPSIDSLSNEFLKYKIYNGDSEKYHIACSWGSDRFPEHQKRRTYIKCATKNINCMIKRYRNERFGT